jgi:hypothetical protein
VGTTRRRFVRSILCAGVGGALTVPLIVSGANAAPAPQPTAPVVLVSGLNNPRQLSLTGSGNLLIAEAGAGGTFKITSPELGTEYVGPSGSISDVTDPATGSNETPNRILTGFLSAAAKNGQQATGSDGVSQLSSDVSVYVQETQFPPLPPFFGAQSGNLYRVPLSSGNPIPVANISAYEAAHDPDGMGIDSDPYAVLRQPGFSLVADAAGNDVLRVNTDGTISTFRVFPNITTGPCAQQQDPPGFPGCNFVPTALATDTLGDVFVTGLASLVPGQGQLVELSPGGAHVLAVFSGFTAPDGVAIGPDGSIYVSQLTGKQKGVQGPIQGLVTRILGGVRTSANVPFPSGVQVDGNGNVFVSAFSIAPAGGVGIPNMDTSGQVWRLTTGSFQ